MMGFVESKDYQKPPDGVRQAADILQYLSRAGNKAAQQRLGELRIFCSHVWSPDDMSKEWEWLYESDRASAVVSDNPLPSSTNTQTRSLVSGPADPMPENGGPSTDTIDPGLELEAWMGWQNSGSPIPTTDGQGPSLLDFDIQDNFVLDLSNEAGDIYSSFNDPALPLTGIDDIDWAEVGKMFYRKT